MKRRDLVPVHHMRDDAAEALDLVRDRSKEEVVGDRVLSLAVVRLLEIVGEAAGRVPTELRDDHAEVPWSEIVGLRNRLIHAYDAVDHDVLWAILQEDLPVLVEQLDGILEDR